MKTFSKRAIWKAINSEHGDRLVQITQEHTKLARSLILDRTQLTDEEAEIYKARIEQLRLERESILQQFVEEESFADERVIKTPTC
ncbi:hypothetical protein [Brevibacillus agri]|uniref:hypothetical protein n=1 Tax=Brevibacillus agri TaxID=51101 RepID=UPI003D1B08EE